MYLAGSVTRYLGSIWELMFSYLVGTLVYVVACLGSKLIWTITLIDWVVFLRVVWVTAYLSSVLFWVIACLSIVFFWGDCLSEQCII